MIEKMMSTSRRISVMGRIIGWSNSLPSGVRCVALSVLRRNKVLSSKIWFFHVPLSWKLQNLAAFVCSIHIGFNAASNAHVSDKLYYKGLASKSRRFFFLVLVCYVCKQPASSGCNRAACNNPSSLQGCFAERMLDCNNTVALLQTIFVLFSFLFFSHLGCLHNVRECATLD